VTQVVRPAPAVYQNIVKEDEDEPAKVGTQHVVHDGSCFNYLLLLVWLLENYSL
jgi:hypothetical protein